jgi:thioesterase domain-containing protein/acyl carrier protein
MTGQNAEIRIRGHVLEPELIIGALKQHPQVSEANLGIVRDEMGRNLLIASVALRSAGAASISDLRAFSRTRLYPQLVPDIFIIRPETPDDGGKPRDPQGRTPISLRINLREQGFQEPRDTTDILLLDIWNDLLERVVGIDNDFFSEGGHSLLAVDLLSRIEKQTGLRLPMSTMLTKTTVRALADTLVNSIAPAVEGEIVELQQGRGGRPLFFLHGDYTGGGFFSRDVAQHADLDGPFLIVQPYGLSRAQGVELPDSIGAMAAGHLEAIRLRQPSGPYRLAGYCNGGIIAYEIAQQLLQAGEKVEFLGMIDPPSAQQTPTRGRRQAAAKTQDPDREAGTPSSALAAEEEYRERLLAHYFRITAAYAASDYREHLTLILVEKKKRNRDPVLEWTNVAKNHAVHRVDAKNPAHLIAIQHNASAIGKILHDAISRQDGQGGGDSRTAEPPVPTRTLANLPYY